MRLYESIYDVYDVFTICTYIQGAAIKPIQEIGPLHASALEKVNTNTIMTLIPLKKNTNSYYLEETMINMSRFKMHCIVLYCIVLCQSPLIASSINNPYILFVHTIIFTLFIQIGKENKSRSTIKHNRCL